MSLEEFYSHRYRWDPYCHSISWPVGLRGLFEYLEDLSLPYLSKLAAVHHCYQFSYSLYRLALVINILALLNWHLQDELSHQNLDLKYLDLYCIQWPPTFSKQTLVSQFRSFLDHHYFLWPPIRQLSLFSIFQDPLINYYSMVCPCQSTY